MSGAMPSAIRHGSHKASQLRQVSNGSESPSSSYKSRPLSAASDTGTAQYNPLPAKPQIERRCNLWVHDDAFSRDEVVLNLDLFPDVKPGELMAIVALKTDSGVRDFQEKPQTNKKDGENLGTAMQRERSSSNPRSPKQVTIFANEVKHDTDISKRYLFIAKDMPKEIKSKHPSLEVSVTKQIAEVFCLKHRSNVLLTVAPMDSGSASYVELTFKDQYLARSDMWRLALGELSKKTVYKGQKILFIGTIKAQVTAVYVDGRKVQSAFFSSNTKPVFRSESARYVLFVQMSREMWDFDSERSGEIMFNKVVNGFLPALFKKWASMKAKHLVSIVLFTRVEYDTGFTSELATSVHDSAYHTGVQAEGSKKPYKDFYRVVVSEMASGSWTTILYQLKREFKFFRRDISLYRIDTISSEDPPKSNANLRGALGTRIEAEPSLAMHGNVLEAINLATSQFSHDYIDRDLMRTGISIVIITPCAGLFEVDYETLRMTTESLIGNGIGIDLVCLPKIPLHSVPLFRYRNPQFAAFQEELHFKSLRSEDSTPRQHTTGLSSSFSSITGSLSPAKASFPDRASKMRNSIASAPPSEWSYAIPHWIDVSFWTGASQDLLLNDSLIRGSSKFPSRFDTQRTSEYGVRCKMYELEMASTIENSLTEISVMPLQLDVLFPQMTSGSQDLPAKQLKYTRPPDLLERKTTFNALTEYVSGPTKSLVDRNSTKNDRSFFKALDAFDLTSSEVMEAVFTVRQRSDERFSFKTGSEEAARKLLAEDPKIFGTSFSEETPKGLSLLEASTSIRNTQDSPHLGQEVMKPRKDKTSVSTSAKSSPVKPAKPSRQISLGKYGFGIAAPKAATAALQIEHVSAARPSTGSAKTSEFKSMTTSNIADHLNDCAMTPIHDRPSTALSKESKITPKTPLPEFVAGESGQSEKKPTSSVRPMAIKGAFQSLDPSNQIRSRSSIGTLHEGIDRYEDTDSQLQSIRPGDDLKVFNSKLLAGSVPELPVTLSPTTALSPWLSVLNPSNPSANDALGPSRYRRWQHVFPQEVLVKTMKWKSLCSPASVPLTTEYFPTKFQLDNEYQQKPYTISQSGEDELSELPKTRDEFLRELVGLRLSHGFQIVIGPAVAEAFGQRSLKIADAFDQESISGDGSSLFMSMGNIIHQLSCVNNTEIEINVFVRKPTASTTGGPSSLVPTVYNPAVRTTIAETYDSRKIILGKAKDEYNWTYVDNFIAGFDDEMSETLRFWRARFVLIPVQRPTQSQRRHDGDNEEEIRLEGIKKLTQIWQRHRVLTASERRFQNAASRKTKDPNPLDIVYKTEDPSVVVTAELETLPLVEGEGTPRRGHLIDTERFRQSKLDIAALSEAIQAPVERGGVRMQNRRWHFRLHYNCFIGSDMTTWIIENFEDVATREEAVQLGNMLMVKEERIPRDKDSTKEKDAKDTGIFTHVEKRHPFRDGQYFYQVVGDYSKQRPESRSGWFGSRRRDNSIPSTPMSDNIWKDSPRHERSRSSSNHDERSSDSDTTTPTTAGGSNKKPKVALSKVMKYDVDHRKRSYRPERINLHYDRLHNPDNCYHIRIDWMSVTAKLIEDAVESWAATAERYGLRLVEAPIGEACSITSLHPFRSPYIIKLAVQPPDQQPRAYFDMHSFSPQSQITPTTRHFYQKAIMKKFNFVLDIEAARNFPSNVDVTYSWGRPDFRYTQYIHRSGVLLAQITDEGDFLLLANRLFNNRTAAARESDRYVKTDILDRTGRIPSAAASHGMADRSSPFNSPLLRPTMASISSPILRASSDVLPGPPLPRPSSMITTKSIKEDLEAFCQSSSELETFYREVFDKATPPSATPPSLKSPYVGSLLDAHIPTLGLPPGILTRDVSPSPMRLATMPGTNAQMLPPALGGRRQSTQFSSEAKVSSPRGSITESDPKGA